MNRFLVINPFGIGDVLFTTPVLRAIKARDPDAFIGYWCNQRVTDVLKTNRNIDRIFALSRGDLKKIIQISALEGARSGIELFSNIRKEKFQVCFDYSLDHRYSLTAKLAGIKKRIGFDYKGRGRFLTDKVYLSAYQDRHVVEYYLDLLKLADIAPAGYGLELVVSQNGMARAKNIFAGFAISRDKPVIAICPGGGASWGKDAALKLWPARKFAQLIDELGAAFGAGVVILGDESDRPLADMAAMSARYKVIDLVGKLSLEESIAVISLADVLVANDGGPLHIAVALGTKTVSFFGPTDPKVYGPYPAQPRHKVLKRALECAPCYRSFRYPRCPKNICLQEIDVREALEAASELLSLKEGN